MGEKKVTIMVLKVDLQCPKCYKKVKKVLCKFPQIQDQVYDEKANTVRIKVVCCNPEKIRDKLCCKGEGSIKSIEIVEPEKPKLPPPVQKPPKEPEKPPKGPEKPPKEPEKPPKEPEKPPKEPEKPPKEPEKPPKEPEKPPKEPEKPPKEPEKPPKEPKVTFVEPAKPSPSPPPAAPVPVPVNPPAGLCCRECYEGHGRGPCYQLGYGVVRHYDGYCGRPVYDSWGSGCGNRGYYRSRCSDYICEENPAAPCTIM